MCSGGSSGGGVPRPPLRRPFVLPSWARRSSVVYRLPGRSNVWPPERASTSWMIVYPCFCPPASAASTRKVGSRTSILMPSV